MIEISHFQRPPPLIFPRIGREFADSRIHGFTDLRIHGFTDSRIHGFTDSRIRGFTDSRIHGFTDSRIHAFLLSCVHVFMLSCCGFNRKTSFSESLYHSRPFTSLLKACIFEGLESGNDCAISVAYFDLVISRK